MPTGGYNDNFVEQGAGKQDFGFSDKSIRARFVRKVFTLVILMLAVVGGMVALPILHQPTKEFIRGNTPFSIASLVIFLVVYIVLICCESVRRHSPTNLICLGILTLAIGYMTMNITAMSDAQYVLIAFGITVGCCAGIVIFSMQTKYDLTSCMGIMCILGFFLLFFGSSQHGRVSAGTGISTRCPSTTPLGLALGPDLPWAD